MGFSACWVCLVAGFRDGLFGSWVSLVAGFWWWLGFVRCGGGRAEFHYAFSKILFRLRWVWLCMEAENLGLSFVFFVFGFKA